MEISQRNGKRYYYLSPGGRNISRLIKTSEKDFETSLKNLLIEVIPVKNISYSIIAPSKKQNILNVSSPRKMCIKCGNIFTPVMWDGWEIKYLSTKNVYVCEECNPELKKIVQEEQIKRSLYDIDMKQIRSKKSKISILSLVNLIVLLAVGLPSINIYFPIIILSTVEVYLIIKWSGISNQIKSMSKEELFRRNTLLNSVKHYDGNLLKIKVIPEFCKECHWFNKDDQKCYVDEETGEIYDDFNLNGETECFKPRKIENL